MTRIFFLAAVVLLFLCSGCAGEAKKTPPEMPAALNAEYSVKSESFSGTLRIVCSGADSVCAEFLTPEALNGMRVEYAAGEYKVSLNGVEKTHRQDELPYDSVPVALIRFFVDALYSAGKTAVYSDGIWNFSSAGASDSYSFDYNGQKGEITSFYLEYCGLRGEIISKN